MGSRWVSWAVRITTATATVDEIGAAVGTEPSRAHERGTPASPRNPKGRRREHAIWLVDSDLPDGATLADHLPWRSTWANAFSARKKRFPDDWSGYVMIGWTPEQDPESVYLDAGLLAVLERTSFNVALGLYPAGAGE